VTPVTIDAGLDLRDVTSAVHETCSALALSLREGDLFAAERLFSFLVDQVPDRRLVLTDVLRPLVAGELTARPPAATELFVRTCHEMLVAMRRPPADDHAGALLVATQDGEDALAMRMMALMLDDLGVASCVSVADDDEWLAHRLRTGREVVACLAVGRELHLDRMAELSRAMKQLRIVILTSAPVVDSAPVIGTGACVGSMGAAVDALLQLRGPLTAAEASALRLAADGYTNVRIARELGVSVSAIKSRLEGSYSKVRAADRTHAVAIALRQHWIR
jgi:DNA-binding CsgD family transcriptional regulator